LFIVFNQNGKGKKRKREKVFTIVYRKSRYDFETNYTAIGEYFFTFSLFDFFTFKSVCLRFLHENIKPAMETAPD